jgi:hypothetical protein
MEVRLLRQRQHCVGAGQRLSRAGQPPRHHRFHDRRDHTQAHGADAVEVQGGQDYSSAWDPILQPNHQVIGTYGSDAHSGVGRGTPADFIDAPTLMLNSLLPKPLRGAAVHGSEHFTGRIVFNLDSSSPAPYPARYQVYVPAGQTAAAVHLATSGGLASGQTIRWIYNSG